MKKQFDLVTTAKCRDIFPREACHKKAGGGAENTLL